jgi:two-component system, OmpR family, sensor kinase
MRGVPVRLRVAVAFAVAMALVLAGTGIFIYARLGDDLATALDQDLRLRAGDVSALLSDPRRSLAGEDPGRLIERGESFAELVDRSGRVLDSTASLHDQPLLAAGATRLAVSGPRFIDVPSVPGLNEPARLLATPIRRGGRALVVVVGATRENRAEALRNLRTELLIAGPVALLLATGLGYLLAGAGLRAVEAMRARAARISADRPGERLPVPPTGDELQRLGETLNAMLARLEDALERERGFVAEAGHELRTPLALLRAELDYALHYAESEAELREALRTASDETDRLVQLAGDLLLIASAEQGEIPLRAEPLEASELLESVKKRFAWRAETQQRPIDLDAQDGLTVTGDRLRLEQALGNLVDNALRYGAGPVRLTARVVNGQIELGVSDEGPGFSPELAGRAFQRFSRGDAARAGQGAGLGLAIVLTIANAHRGSAEARTGDGGGADVVIRLPGPGSYPEAGSRRRDPRMAR